MTMGLSAIQITEVATCNRATASHEKLDVGAPRRGVERHLVRPEDREGEPQPAYHQPGAQPERWSRLQRCGRGDGLLWWRRATPRRPKASAHLPLRRGGAARASRRRVVDDLLFDKLRDERRELTGVPRCRVVEFWRDDRRPFRRFVGRSRRHRIALAERDVEFDRHPAVVALPQFEVMVGTVELPQALAGVAQADPFASRLGVTLRLTEPDSVILDAQDRRSPAAPPSPPLDPAPGAPRARAGSRSPPAAAG